MFVTLWSKNVKKRKGPDAGKVVKEFGLYHTKSLTKAHARIHQQDPEAVTIAHPNRVYTHFIYPSIPLDQPIISGGFRVNPELI